MGIGKAYLVKNKQICYAKYVSLVFDHSQSFEYIMRNMSHFIRDSDMSLQDFKKICDRQTDIKNYPLAASVDKNIVIYKGDFLNQKFSFKDEIIEILLNGPGIFVVRNFYQDVSIVDNMSKVFDQILKNESNGKGDHFGDSTVKNANSRIWDSFTKAAVVSPSTFTAYFSNPLLKIISESWLGPGFQMTSQVNIVHPKGKSQISHRDYHLGFQNLEVLYEMPLHVHDLSSKLTLQGAIAHTDIPIESGSTKLLPFSQHFRAVSKRILLLISVVF